MLQNKIFGIFMAVGMVLGMEIYNAILQHGISGETFLQLPWGKAVLVVIIVMVVQHYVGGPAATWLSGKITKEKTVSARQALLARQFSTVCFMCPMMSMVAMFLFKGGMQPGFWALYGKTVACNFPMAFCWSVFVVGPLVRYIVGNVFTGRRTAVSRQ